MTDVPNFTGLEARVLLKVSYQKLRAYVDSGLIRQPKHGKYHRADVLKLAQDVHDPERDPRYRAIATLDLDEDVEMALVVSGLRVYPCATALEALSAADADLHVVAIVSGKAYKADKRFWSAFEDQITLVKIGDDSSLNDAVRLAWGGVRKRFKS